MERSSYDDGLFVRVIGGCTVHTADGSVVAIKNRKARAVLAYLAMTSGRTESRERLAGLLWSDRSEEQARASLRQCLKQLRQALADTAGDSLQTERREVGLAGEGIRLDLDEILLGIEDGRGAEPTTEPLDPKRILYGFEGLDQSFDAWLHVVRQRWHDHLIAGLEQRLRLQPRDDLAGRRTAEALLQIDPTHEEAHRYLIALFARHGNLGAALRQYNGLWHLLDEEYDMEPAEETQALIVRIKSGSLGPAEDGGSPSPGAANPEPLATTRPDDAADRVPPALGLAMLGSPSPGLSLPGGSSPHAQSPDGPRPDPVQGGPRPGAQHSTERRRMIVVDRFETEGVAADRTYVVNGFRQGLIASLVRFRDWIVVEGSDVDRRAPSGVTPDLHYKVHAIAFDAGSKIDLILTLKDSETSQYIWSDRYSIDLERWVDAQRLIVRRIAVALNVHTSAEFLARLSSRAELPTAVYDRWLRGQDLYLRWRPKDSQRASEIFRSIIDEAPDFAPAYSSLVQILNSRHIIFPGIERTPEREAEALSLAQTAVRLDPLDSKTHLCLAWSSALNRRFDQAQLSFELAHDLNENDPWTLVSSSHGIAFCGRKAEALARADQALRLGLGVSEIHWAYQAGIRFLCEDYEGCVKAADLAQNAIYDLGGWKAAALSHLGDLDRARVEGRRFVELIRANWHGHVDDEGTGVGAWLLHNFPFREERDRERLREGLRSAGVPVPSYPGTKPRKLTSDGHPQRDSE